jgi:hypothetical protein
MFKSVEQQLRLEDLEIDELPLSQRRQVDLTDDPEVTSTTLWLRMFPPHSLVRCAIIRSGILLATSTVLFLLPQNTSLWIFLFSRDPCGMMSQRSEKGNTFNVSPQYKKS